MYFINELFKRKFHILRKNLYFEINFLFKNGKKKNFFSYSKRIMKKKKLCNRLLNYWSCIIKIEKGVGERKEKLWIYSGHTYVMHIEVVLKILEQNRRTNNTHQIEYYLPRTSGTFHLFSQKYKVSHDNPYADFLHDFNNNGDNVTNFLTHIYVALSEMW